MIVPVGGVCDRPHIRRKNLDPPDLPELSLAMAAPDEPAHHRPLNSVLAHSSTYRERVSRQGDDTGRYQHPAQSCPRHLIETTARPFLPHPRHRSRPLRSRTFVARLNPSLCCASGVGNATWAARFTPASVSTLPGSSVTECGEYFPNLLLDVTNRYVDIMPQSETPPLTAG
jgi:hypothetical protein